MLLLLRAVALACRGHQEVVLENMALRHHFPPFPFVTDESNRSRRGFQSQTERGFRRAGPDKRGGIVDPAAAPLAVFGYCVLRFDVSMSSNQTSSPTRTIVAVT